MTAGERLTRVIELVEQGRHAQFAAKIGCIPSTLSRICNDKMPLTHKRAQKICSVYPDVSIDFLMGMTDNAGRADAQARIEQLENAIREKDRTIAVLTRQIALLQDILDRR